MIYHEPKGDCIIVFGDFNEELPRGVKGRTGGHTLSELGSANADKIVGIMRANDLCAVNTLFNKPRKSATTYLHVKKLDTVQETIQYCGRKVRTKWNGRIVEGTVLNRVKDVKKWRVKFSDGYIVDVNERRLRDMVVRNKRNMTDKQLDYILVSNRWRSNVRDANVRWGPSEHRNIHSRADHALVECQFTWRIRSPKIKKKKDFNALFACDRGVEEPNGIGVLQTFDESIVTKLQEIAKGREGNAEVNIDQQYADMCGALQYAISTLPDIARTTHIVREVSQRTKDLFAKRVKLGRKKSVSEGEFKAVQRDIKDSTLADFKQWVDKWVQDMDEANKVGDTKRVWKGVRVLSGKVNTKPPINLTQKNDGSSIDNPEMLVKVWFKFLRDKFAATQREREDRPEWSQLPPRDPTNVITDAEFKAALGTMKKGKAVGPDKIPIEVFKASELAREMLLDLLQRIWKEEKVPESFGRAVFVMLFKHKGSTNDPSKYRCIGLLNHAYKMLSTILLGRLTKETGGYLQDWQAGFRKQRGCRDNVFILRTLVEQAMKEGKKLALTFIDYSAAFDSVSHKFIDTALTEAGASPKSRAIFRSIYKTASAMTEVTGPDGETVFSDAFPVRRGVVQGDITSPLYFILALECILRRHDKRTDKGTRTSRTNTWIHTLGYADDAVLVDEGVEIATERVNAIACGSRRDADMHINVGQTECMHLQQQDPLHKPTSEEVKKECKYTCKHKGCMKVFANKHGLRVHEGKCPWKHEYDIERILDVRWPQESSMPVGHGDTKFLVRWKGYGQRHDQWEPYKHLHPAKIKEFLQANGMYDYEWRHRCPRCDKPMKSQAGVAIHLRRKSTNCRSYLEDHQNFTGTEAERKAKERQKENQQESRPIVLCDGEPLKNCYLFKYLGSMFAADGSDELDVRRRIGIAQSRLG